MWVAGLGCRRLCTSRDIIGAIQVAERAASRKVDALAAPAFKQAEPGLLEAAFLLGLPLHFLDAAAMARAQPRAPTKSAKAQQATGYSSIAEAAAIAAAGGTLVLPRVTYRGATCAIAEVARPDTFPDFADPPDAFGAFLPPASTADGAEPTTGPFLPWLGEGP